MPVFYSKIHRVNPANRTEKKWYAVLKRLHLVKEKEIAKLIADETTMNPKEVEMALALFEKILIRELLNGNSVQLGDWASFHLTCNSEGKEKKEEVTTDCIQKVNIRFTPGRTLRDAIKGVKLRSLETL